ncbi:phosphatase domain-containing protein [Yoonia algicola]|uniref:Phosphatase domain-containing protein n=1 Tax=Yoonia algicola TaxID=3137368 RepID=A0AAN0NH27_9RHOB
MSWKLILARAFHKVERGFDRSRRAPARDNPVIDCYGGYATRNHIILRGRVLAKARAISGDLPQSKWRNFRDFLSLFYTEELIGIEIVADHYGERTVTDEEGFFVLMVKRDNAALPPAINIHAAGSDVTHQAPVYGLSDAPFGVISDIDDTILRTGAYLLIKNLWVSATGNVHEREVFPDAVGLLQQFATQGARFFCAI